MLNPPDYSMMLFNDFVFSATSRRQRPQRGLLERKIKSRKILAILIILIWTHLNLNQSYLIIQSRTESFYDFLSPKLSVRSSSASELKKNHNAPPQPAITGKPLNRQNRKHTNQFCSFLRCAQIASASRREHRDADRRMFVQTNSVLLILKMAALFGGFFFQICSVKRSFKNILEREREKREIIAI